MVIEVATDFPLTPNAEKVLSVFECHNSERTTVKAVLVVVFIKLK